MSMTRTIRCRHPSVPQSPRDPQRKGWTEKEDEEEEEEEEEEAAGTGTERRGSVVYILFFPLTLSTVSLFLFSLPRCSLSLSLSRSTYTHHSFNASSVHSFSQSVIIIRQTTFSQTVLLLLACYLRALLLALLHTLVAATH
jgi:hypothetical protein